MISLRDCFRGQQQRQQLFHMACNLVLRWSCAAHVILKSPSLSHPRVCSVSKIVQHPYSSVHYRSLATGVGFPRASRAPTAANNEAFHYENLPLGSIRLLHLFPDPISSNNLKFRCKISHHVFEEAPEYKALSYVWGDAAETCSLGCNGALIEVTTNLAAALSHLVSLLPPQMPIWIDQICINQDNLEERAQQVNMMGSIFKKAKDVIMWLGTDPDGHAIRTKQLMHLMSKQSDQTRELYSKGGDLGNLPFLSSENRKLLCHFYILPYFERVWILQEVLLASSKVMVWGDQYIDFVDFQWTTWTLSRLARQKGNSVFPGYQSGFARAAELVDAPRDIRGLLFKSANRKALDQRDKVFAILGLIETTDSMMKADYNKSVEEVYSDFTRFLICRQMSLDILSDVFHGSKPLASDGWPSWVPRMRGGPGTLVNLGPDLSASANLPVRLGATSSIDLNTLSLAGVEICKVEYVSSPLPQPPPTIEDYAPYMITYQIMDAWKMVLQHHITVPPDDSLIKAFIWTLLCGASDLASDFKARWTDRLLVQFASWYTWGLLAAMDSDLYGWKCCLRQYLDIPCLALFTHAGFEANLLPHREFIISNLTNMLVAQLKASTDTSNQYRAWKQREKVIRDQLSKYHPEPNQTIIESITPLLAFYSAEPLHIGINVRYQTIGMNRRFFITADGHMGMGPVAIEEGDIVVILFGGKVPYVLRPMGKTHSFVGECYVNDVMGGGAITRLQEEETLESMTKYFKLR